MATFFRNLQRHYVPFMDMLSYQLSWRREFERMKASDPRTLTDLERAARFLYLQRLAFGGRVASQHYGVSYGPSRFDVTRLGPMLEAIHERLAGVTIEHLPCADFIDRYDRPETLFYLDPPYWGSEGDYGKKLFGREQFAQLADRLGRLKGRFVLSINDEPEVRAIFAGYVLREVELNYSITSGHGTRAKELIISD